MCVRLLGVNVSMPQHFPVSTSQRTQYVFITKPSRLIRFRETIAVYFDNNTKTRILNVKAGGTYRYHYGLKY
jgi:uncharacterized protein (DUF1499 family)